MTADLRPMVHTCWDDHEGPDGAHLDGSDIGTLPVDVIPGPDGPPEAVSDGLGADQEAELLALEF